MREEKGGGEGKKEGREAGRRERKGEGRGRGEEGGVGPILQRRSEMTHLVLTKGSLWLNPCYLGPVLKSAHHPLSFPFSCHRT